MSGGSTFVNVLVRELPQGPIAEQIDVIIQTTPIGLQGMNAPIEWLDWFVQPAKAQLFFDMVYSADSRRTPLVEHFLNRGLRAVDGTEMLVEQACLAFEFWTGRLPPVEIMRAALDNARTTKQ